MPAIAARTVSVLNFNTDWKAFKLYLIVDFWISFKWDELSFCCHFSLTKIYTIKAAPIYEYELITFTIIVL